MKERLSWLFAHYLSSKHDEMLIAIWAIWTNRNKFYHEGKVRSSGELTSFIQAHVQEYAIVTASVQPHSSLVSVLWKPPPTPMVKANFDAAFSRRNSEAWSGIVVRNHDGHILGAARRKIVHASSPFLAEATASLHAIQFSKDLGSSQVVVEGDARSVLLKLQGNEPDYSETGAII
ncbi:uncharacterized protein LOC120139206 [Hibiscus syriacus]|uniref:uncharacterized protein LOC120139206 n=1 Tax=Hibiscus syriacus TaxID=106335 RepID=UPI001923C4E4|nr:uncharacterized protein LOC120139206 [Hibiscus syriacus]